METDLYPSIGLCWTMTIREEILKQYESNFNSTNYVNFLSGTMWNEGMRTVDYDNVTPQLSDFVLGYGYWTFSEKDIRLYVKERGDESKPGFKEYAIFGMKCFTIYIPFRQNHKIQGFGVHFKPSIFGEKGRLANPGGNTHQENEFQVILHYRNQIIRRAIMAKRTWPYRGDEYARPYLMRLIVENIDVMVRRNTDQKPCIEGAPNYDQDVINYVLGKVNCKPPYLNSTSNLNPCTEQKQLKELGTLIHEAIYMGNGENFYTVKPPCRSLERIFYDGIDVDTPQKYIEDDPWMNDTVGLMLDFKEWTYKEVKSVRGMDIQALIGKYSMNLFN